MPTPPLPASFSPVEITGFVDADGDPIDQMGRNANWVYANHRPPAHLSTPIIDLVANANYQAPIEPSADGLVYEVYLSRKAGLVGATVTWTVQYGTTGSVQPGSGTGWTTLATVSGEVLTPSQEKWGEVATVTIPATATHIRVVQACSSGTVQLQSILILPDELSAIPTGARPSGFVAWINAMIEGEGPNNPEQLNRIWTNINATVGDRVQCVAALVQSDNIPMPIEPTTTKPFVTAMLAPAWLEGQGGASLKVRVGAKADADGCTITVGQQGGESVSFDVYNGLFYTYQADTIDLTHGAPVFYAVAGGPDGAQVDVLYIVISWRPGD